MPVLHSTRKKKPSEDSDDEQNEPVDEDEETHSMQSRGTVLITLRNVPPYTHWWVHIVRDELLGHQMASLHRDLPKLAKNPPPPTGGTPPNPRYVQLRSFRFDRMLWKGYEHRMTKGERAHGKGTTGIGGEDRTWEFYLRD